MNEEEYEEEYEEERTFSIVQMSGFISGVARNVADEMEISNAKEVFDFISEKQIEGIVEESKLGNDDEGLPIINADTYIKIMNEVMQRVQSGALAQLAADGFLDCAWDDELNDMVFWLADNSDDDKPENNKNTLDKPE